MNTNKAASILLSNWNAVTRIDALPDDCRPSSRAEGYQIGEAIVEKSNQEVAGWKIAATSEAGQRHINVDGPIIGRILAHRLLTPDSTIPLGDNIMRVIEAEFAFGFGSDLPERETPYTMDETLAAVTTLHLSIEVPDSRYTDFTKVGVAQLIADTACADWLVLGPPILSDWRGIDLANHKVTGIRNGEQVVEGSGAAVLGDPRLALTWFANEAASYCGGVKAGQFVTTGTCIIPMAIAPGDDVTMDYGVLGTISASIS